MFLSLSCSLTHSALHHIFILLGNLNRSLLSERAKHQQQQLSIPTACNDVTNDDVLQAKYCLFLSLFFTTRFLPVIVICSMAPFFFSFFFSSVCRRCLHGACCRCQPARSAATAAVIKSLPVLSSTFAEFSLYQKAWRLVFISVRYHHLLLQQQQQPLTDNFPTDNC